MNYFLRHFKLKFVGLILSITSSSALATTTTDLPFNSTLDTLSQAISGPFLTDAAVIMIVVTCLMLAFGEWGDGFKKIITIVMWLSIAFAALVFIKDLFTVGAVM